MFLVCLCLQWFTIHFRSSSEKLKGQRAWLLGEVSTPVVSVSDWNFGTWSLLWFCATDKNWKRLMFLTVRVWFKFSSPSSSRTFTLDKWCTTFIPALTRQPKVFFFPPMLWFQYHMFLNGIEILNRTEILKSSFRTVLFTVDQSYDLTWQFVSTKEFPKMQRQEEKKSFQFSLMRIGKSDFLSHSCNSSTVDLISRMLHTSNALDSLYLARQDDGSGKAFFIFSVHHCRRLCMFWARLCFNYTLRAS